MGLMRPWRSLTNWKNYEIQKPDQDKRIAIALKLNHCFAPYEELLKPQSSLETVGRVYTLNKRKTLRAKLVDLSTFCAVPGSPLLTNFEPYWIARHILSLASALFRYRIASASSALAPSNELIFFFFSQIKLNLINFDKQPTQFTNSDIIAITQTINS